MPLKELSSRPRALAVVVAGALAVVAGVGATWWLLALATGDSCDIRFVPHAFAGKAILHCHVLEHEDQGAMGWARIEEGAGAQCRGGGVAGAAAPSGGAAYACAAPLAGPRPLWNASSAPVCIPDVPDLVFDANNSATLSFGQHSFSYGSGGGLTTRAFSQGGTLYFPGAAPTIRMAAGSTYRVTLQNTLPFAPLEKRHNEYQDPQVTNLHTHGLHISGENPADDVTRVVNGGECTDYVYEITADHMGGTHWYHPHHHGSTLLHVAGGALGMIVIENTADNLPPGLRGMPQRELTVAQLDPSVAEEVGDPLLRATGGFAADGYAVNGVFGGDVCIPRNEWHYVRLLLATPDAALHDIVFGPECEVRLLARDGVYRAAGPRRTNAIRMTGASRADFAVSCSADSELRVGQRNLVTVARIVASQQGGSGAASSPQPFPVSPSEWAAVQRPTYLQDLRAQTPANLEAIEISERAINRLPFEKSTPTFTIGCEQLQQWSVEDSDQHPFHVHVNHFQLVSNCGGDFEVGEFYDTLAGARQPHTAELVMYGISGGALVISGGIGIFGALTDRRALVTLQFVGAAIAFLWAPIQLILSGAALASCDPDAPWNSMCVVPVDERWQFWFASILLGIVELGGMLTTVVYLRHTLEPAGGSIKDATAAGGSTSSSGSSATDSESTSNSSTISSPSASSSSE